MAEKKSRKIGTSTATKWARLYLPIIASYHRAKFKGLRNIPSVPFLAVGNHLGMHFMPESLLWLTKYHSMNKKIPMKTLVHHISHDLAAKFKLPLDDFGILEATPDRAYEALKAGNAVTVYPGSDRENAKPFKDRYKVDFFGHLGYVKLALRAGVPILPVVGIGGGETLFVLSAGEGVTKLTGLEKTLQLHTWPVYWSFPFGWHVGHFPRFSIPLPSQVTISILKPYSLDNYKESDADNLEIVEKINEDIIHLMQIEMDKLAKGRIPLLGKKNS